MMEQEQARTFRSVILATDFSPAVRTASRYAALLAQHYDAELVVVHAFTLQQPAFEAEELSHAPSMQRQHLERLLTETVEGLAPWVGQGTSVLDQGSPIEVIERASRDREPALIVLGTHGGGAAERHVIGSVAEDVLRTVHRPVLTVGPHVTMPSTDKLTFRHILYATDFSPASARAAVYAFAFAQAFGSDVDVLHVLAEGRMGAHKQLAEEENKFLGALGRLIPQQAEAIGSSRSFVEFGRVRERVIEHARERGVDLIVLGAHHHSHLSMHLRTGPAFHIILDATCPVLTLCAQ
jgi:nucleotide-binding universal stress UspA family protein